MYYRCPVCNGKGKVESEFGGGSPHDCPQSCPACEGTGMQFVSESTGIKIVKIQRPPLKVWPPTNPFQPRPPIQRSPFDIPKPKINPYLPRYKCTSITFRN